MNIDVKVFARLRELLDPKPELGEAISVEINEGDTIMKVIHELGLPQDDVTIIMVDGNHQTLDYRLQKDDKKISLFPASGGG